jgi:prepilin-type N-terminal cleavage/methylation domain-containing protein
VYLTRGAGAGCPAPLSSRRRGFTLLEVLLTLAIIGLMAGVLVVGSVRLTEPKAATPEDVFWKALGDARREALLSGHEVRLRFVKKNKAASFVISGPAGEKTVPLDDPGELVVDFLSTQKAGSAILIRSQLVETQTIPYVTFYGDGTCTPFRAQFRSGGPARSVSIDPWTCAPIITQADAPRSR